MFRRIWPTLVFGLICFSGNSSSNGVIAQSTAATTGFTDSHRRTKLATAFADVDRMFSEFAKSSHVPGAAWGIIIDGELAHSGATGVHDIKTNAPVDADTVFRIASMTKSFTAMAILKLRDEGKLSWTIPPSATCRS